MMWRQVYRLNTATVTAGQVVVWPPHNVLLAIYVANAQLMAGRCWRGSLILQLMKALYV